MYLICFKFFFLHKNLSCVPNKIAKVLCGQPFGCGGSRLKPVNHPLGCALGYVLHGIAELVKL